MRRKLGKLKNRKYAFTGTIDRVTSCNVLIRDVKLFEGGQFITDHIWIPQNTTIRNMRLRKGDMVRFSGVPGIYFKGVAAETMDYRIAQISNFQILNRNLHEERFRIKFREQVRDWEEGFFETEEALFAAEHATDSEPNFR